MSKVRNLSTVNVHSRYIAFIIFAADRGENPPVPPILFLFPIAFYLNIASPTFRSVRSYAAGYRFGSYSLPSLHFGL